MVLAPVTQDAAAPGLGAWYAEAEAAAIAAVEERKMPEAFLDHLPRLGRPRAVRGGDLWLSPGAAPDPLALAPGLAAGDAGLWWSAGSPLVEPATLLCPRGMPDPARFAALLDGSWAEHGWDVPARDPLEAAS